MKKSITTTLCALCWLIPAMLMIFASLIYKFAPKELILPGFEGFSFFDYSMIAIFIIVGIGLLKLYRWAWLIALLLSISYLFHFTWIAVRVKYYIMSDLFFAVFQSALLIIPTTRRQFFKKLR